VDIFRNESKSDKKYIQVRREIHLGPQAKHACHCTDCHETDSCLKEFHEEILYLISPQRTSCVAQCRVEINSRPYLMSNCHCTDIYETHAWSTPFCEELPAEFNENSTDGLVADATNR
jgi:hypothetical protein